MTKMSQRNVAVLGSTGSIGTATLDVLKGLRDRFRVWALSAHSQIDLLHSQIAEFQPEFAALTTDDVDLQTKWRANSKSHASNHNPSNNSGAALRHLLGSDALCEIASHRDVDVVVAAIVGVAGLESAIAAAKAGKLLALANKEALVVAGSLMTQAVSESGAKLVPVDSEHSAIFQCLQSGRDTQDIERIILTASGGSLREWPLDRLSEATIEDALAHPTWSMGRKITIDSATMMNKALEIIEAKWLFGLPPEKISVVIHPQSFIHSMVEFVDGSIVAQMCPPDMRLPIQYALTHPERLQCPARKVDWTQSIAMDWRPADLERYPALALGFEVAASGGTSGAVLNGANEAAVELFLNGQIGFTDITKICRQVLEHHNYDPSPSLETLLQRDRWARNQVQRWKQVECN